MTTRMAESRLNLTSQTLTGQATVRLDRLEHPYGPCPAAFEALHAEPTGSSEAQSDQLRRRLSEVFRVKERMICLLDGKVEGLANIVQAAPGPLVSFPPSEIASLVQRNWPSRAQVAMPRGVGATARLVPDLVADLPSDGLAIIDFPSDPLGTLLAPTDAVRLARACKYLVVDERFAEFAGLSLLSLATEFDNIVIMRSFDVWAGLAAAPCSWIVAPPRARRELGLESAVIDAATAAAALATLDDLPSVEATLRVVRSERSHLYRMLRKISFLEPVPSWGPFVAARVGLGRRDQVVRGLKDQGVIIHVPQQKGLEAYIRFGIGARSDMDRLQSALLAVAGEIVA
jgi:histidinol-phosphate aminotransferase